MDVLTAIKTRRSIRNYTQEPVSDELIRQLLEAAMMAPSAGNAQPWQFVVVQDRAKLDAVPNIHAHAAMSKRAPVAFLICADLDLESYPGNWPADCSAATQNLLLAAHALGLGAVWCSVWPDEACCDRFRDLLGIPKHVVPLAWVPVGYPHSLPESPDRFKAERVHRDRW